MALVNAFAPVLIFYLIAGMSMLGLKPAAAQSILAGVAQVDITPPVDQRPIPLNGYGERKRQPATGIHDPLTASALVLENGNGRLALVTTDLLWVTIDLTRKVLEYVQTPGIGPGSVFLSASHSHSGPAAMDKRIVYQQAFGAFDEELFESTARKIAQAIDEAARHLRPARVGVGQRMVPNAVKNRRDGETTTDSEMTVVRIADEKGDIAVIVNFAAHATILGPDNFLVSADYPGALRRALAQRLGNGAVVLFMNGAEGDQTHMADGEVDAFERAEHYGERLAQAAHEIWESISLTGQVALAWDIVDLQLPAPRVPVRWRSYVNDDVMKLIFPPSAPLSAVRLGDALLVGVPGELVADLGLAIKENAEAAGVRCPVVVSLVNEYLGYILTPEQYNGGGYEAGFSFYGEEFGPAIATGAGAAIGALMNGHPSGQ